jgi:hypothetical protein
MLPDAARSFCATSSFWNRNVSVTVNVSARHLGAKRCRPLPLNRRPAFSESSRAELP